MHLTKPARILFLGAVVSSIAAVACGIVIKRDLSATPVGQVGFDDMCGLQEYFDSLEGKVSKPPAVASSVDLEGVDGQKTVRGGRVMLVYEGEFLLTNARRVLEANWRRLPESLATTDKITIEATWAERAGVKRLVTDKDAELLVDGKSYDLPYQVCLSEFLFGAPLYKQRQVLWGLHDPSTRRPLQLALDASAPDGQSVIDTTPDAGPRSVPTPTPAPPAPPAR